MNLYNNRGGGGINKYPVIGIDNVSYTYIYIYSMVYGDVVGISIHSRACVQGSMALLCGDLSAVDRCLQPKFFSKKIFRALSKPYLLE